MSVIASSAIENDEELHLTARQWEKVREKGFDNCADESESEVEAGDEDDSSEEESEIEGEFEKDEEASESESVDSEVARIEEMADQYEENLKRGKEYSQVNDKKHNRKEHKKKLLIEQQR